jgi:hypothetical protein
MARIYVTPAEGRNVTDPERGDLLPAGGRSVEDSQYWRRRLAAADVTITPAPEDPPVTPDPLTGLVDARLEALGLLAESAEPTAPLAVYAQAGYQSVTVTWSPPAFGNPTGHRITWTGGTADVGAGVYSYTITGLTNGVAQSPTVAALNAAGAGPAATANTVTPSALIPAGLRQPGLLQIIDPDTLTGANGSTVTGGTDASGNGKTWTVGGSPVLKTAGLNSHKAITTAAGAYPNTGLRFTPELDGKPQLGSHVTLFLVFTITTLADSKRIIGTRSQAADTAERVALDLSLEASTYRLVDDQGNNYGPAIAEWTMAAATPYILTIQRPGYLYLNGAKGGDRLNAVAPNDLDDLLLHYGYYFGGKGLGGDVHYSAAFNRLLTQAQRWAAEAELASRFSITVTQE